MNKEQIKEELRSYIGIKLVKSYPMTRGEYNQLRGWTVPSDENPEDEGYLVEYQDSKPNVEGFEGYISWSTKEVFDEVYTSVPMNGSPNIPKSIWDNYEEVKHYVYKVLDRMIIEYECTDCTFE